MRRKIFRILGEIFLRPALEGVVSVIMGFLSPGFFGVTVTNLPLFIATIIGGALLAIVVAQAIGHFFLWISRRFHYITITPFHENSRLISLRLRNEYDDDVNDFKLTLHRASTYELPVDLIVPFDGSEFNATDGVKEGRFIAKQPATIFIAEIPKGKGNHIYTKILSKDEIMNDAMYKKNNKDSVAFYEIVFEVTGKIQDELISRWYLARFKYWLTEEDRKPDEVSLHWIGLRKYSKSEHEKRNKRVYSQPIQNRVLNESIYENLKDMKKECFS